MLSETDTVNVGDIRFDRKDVLGSGGYGSVYRGNYKGQSIAVKRVEKRAGRVQLVENELNILKKLDHPNIVKLLHFDSDADFQYFVLEICNTSLEQVFRNRDSREEEGGENSRKDKRPTLPNNFEVFFQLASGEEITIKWADFGLSRAVNERGTFTMSGVRGTLRWFAPEVLKIHGENLRIEETRGNIQSDVFAEGLVFGYILLKGSHIYGQKEEEIVKNIRENRPINMDQIHQLHWARNLIEQMLTNTPENRITSEEVVAQLQSTRIKLIEEEKNLRRLCADKSTMSDFRKNIEPLIQIGIDFNAKDKGGWNALHHLCFNSSSPHLIEAIQELIKLGIDKDAKTEKGWNALHLLCSNRQYKN
ncbi:serine/threonine-protein kinase/endoribonuclease IRE1-like [Daphnia magna]|uniref:serine/threonine-protein kinase/endoribonuclease IRE1-like n=1 Tax=Daphnia magna TaxID=35525 RepID=UPI001E1BB95C|nr:serine/threonine-protein kinase/endoribonuclease IRE1-like [Daphnia magna]